LKIQLFTNLISKYKVKYEAKLIRIVQTATDHHCKRPAMNSSKYSVMIRSLYPFIITKIRGLFGDLIIDDRNFRIKIHNTVDELVKTIQSKFDMQKLHRILEAIMNCWIRTLAWYDEYCVSKFERCLDCAVAAEMIEFMCDFLKTRKEDLENGMTLNDSDFFDALQSMSVQFSSRNWETEPRLTHMAILCAQHYGDYILCSDYDQKFSWFSNETKTRHYHLPHIPKSAKPLDVVALKLLPDDFKYETEWTCSICLGVDVVNSSCVRTACMHVFHKSCFESWNCKFLEQEDNGYKIYSPCPMCRANVHYSDPLLLLSL
jgi:hypothetical protein